MGDAMTFPTAQYGVLYADPPWKYEMYSDKGKQRSPDRHYPCMSLDELKSMRDDVIFATAPNSVCIMWATFPKLLEAVELMECWGFQYKTGGPWIKRAGNGNPSMGTGFIVRGASEIFLIGTHGNPKIKNKKTRNLLLTGTWPETVEDIDSVILDSLRREHSRKPDEMYAVIENLFEGAYLELFATQRWAGWDAWGNQIGKFGEEAA